MRGVTQNITAKYQGNRPIALVSPQTSRKKTHPPPSRRRWGNTYFKRIVRQISPPEPISIKLRRS